MTYKNICDASAMCFCPTVLRLCTWRPCGTWFKPYQLNFFLLIHNLIFYSTVRGLTKFKTYRSLSDLIVRRLTWGLDFKNLWLVRTGRWVFALWLPKITGDIQTADCNSILRLLVEAFTGFTTSLNHANVLFNFWLQNSSSMDALNET